MNTIYKIRYILNVLFLVGAAATIILYFAMSGSSLFLYVGTIAMTCKMIEFILRFMF
ncbi:MAG: hypothetical protein IJC92_05885 [Bacteroidaceae bacterium]|nr:hypothetical protein [Bacteroidaceae bacterium]MBQ8365258.1 hypothetical protein [Bacteroidaceae bacterium]